MTTMLTLSVTVWVEAALAETTGMEEEEARGLNVGITLELGRGKKGESLTGDTGSAPSRHISTARWRGESNWDIRLAACVSIAVAWLGKSEGSK